MIVRVVVIVVDRRVTKTAMMADVFLPIKPRGDLALLNAMLRIVIDESLYDREYVESHTTGLDDLRVSLQPYTLEYASEVTGLDRALIRRVAHLHATAKALFIGWTMGVNHSTKGTETVNAINNLALITGNVGHARIWNMDADRTPSRRGLAYPDIIEAAVAGKIRGLCIIGTNPLVWFPNIDVLKQGLENLDFLAPFPEQPNAEFPFVLNTGRTVEHWHTRSKTGAISILQEMSPRAWLEMNPADAHRLNLKPHDRVDVISARGRVSRVELRVTEIIAARQVFLPFHFVETNANQITQSAFDPISREPNFKQCAVRVEKSVAGLSTSAPAIEPSNPMLASTSPKT